MPGGERHDSDEAAGLIRRLLRRADEVLRGSRSDDVAAKAGGSAVRSSAAPDERDRSQRLGQLLVDDGVLSWEQLGRALIRQRELKDRGTWWTLGEVVVEMKFA